MSELFIFGYGFTSKAVASAVANDFNKITGTTRRETKFDLLKADQILPTIFDGKELSEATKAHLSTASHLLISIAPNEDGDPVLNACKKVIESNKNLQWIGYLSTVGVYGNHDGAWVDETTICKPVSKRSLQRVAAEEEWTQFAQSVDVPLAIFRLSGIYGPGRNTFMNIEKGKARRLIKKDQVFNRIHRDDIGMAVKLSIDKTASGIFNITDDMPAPPQDVVTYAFELRGETPPEPIDFETADLTPMARSFYGENKRVSNAKSKEVLGLVYRWPNYKASLKRMWDETSWKA